MGGWPQRSARTDAPQFADIAIPVDIFPDGGYTCYCVLAKEWYFDLFLFIVRRQLHLVVCAYCSIQVAAVADNV